MKKFSELQWHMKDGDDALELYVAVSIMPQAFEICPSIEKTRDMEAKMPYQIVRKMKEVEAKRLRERGLSDRFIYDYLRMEPEFDPIDIIPDCDLDDFNFTAKNKNRAIRIHKANRDRLRRSWEKARIARDKAKETKATKRKLRHMKTSF